MTASQSSRAARRSSRWLAAALCAWLAAMLWNALPRNVGDSSEYLGMAINLASGRPPSLSDQELRDLAAAAGQSGAGFELETRRIPEMRGRDGRYDMPHMWVYSLIATPGVWLARAAGAAPAWGFLFTNLTLVGALIGVIVWRGGAGWALAVVASPLVWWLDKPLAEVLMASGLLYGAAFGAVFGFAGHALSGGHRDFASRSQIVAARYDVVADAEVAEEAKNLLIKLGWRED